MIILISLAIGFAAGCFVNYAIIFNTGKARNVGICIAGALVGGALIPMVLRMPSAWAAIIGSVLGVAIVLWASFKAMKKA
ncbi:MAG TPA: hypothetical protein ENK80_05015 [Rhodobacterales bacterium]|nr:hypothetical protein [Rhodobacterales bacterium]